MPTRQITTDQTEATHALTMLGWKASRIATLLGISERTVHRFRSEARKDADMIHREFAALGKAFGPDGD